MPRKPAPAPAAERAARPAQSPAMRAAWARGVFAHRPPAVQPDRWTLAHDRRLGQLVGTRTLPEIAAALSAEFPGTPRTATAVRVRCTRLGLDATVQHYTAGQVARLCGVTDKTVTRWIARGWLEGSQLQPGHAGSSWSITAAQVEAFLRTYRHAYDWRKMPRGRWRNLAELVWRADPLFTLPEASRITGLPVDTLWRHLARGWLVGHRQFRRGGARGGTWLVARSALRAWLARTEGAA